MKKSRTRRVLMIGILVLIIFLMTLVVFVWIDRKNASPEFSQRALWISKGIDDYALVVNVSAPPVPSVGLALVIQDGNIVEHRILACHNPSQTYPARDCPVITQYYSQMGRYTVEQLFDLARDCLDKTASIVSDCSGLSAAIDPFANALDAGILYTVAEVCAEQIQVDDVLCQVEYDIDYGFPIQILHYSPMVLDGFASITVTDFHATALTSESSE